jgi:hypothetical protein
MKHKTFFPWFKDEGELVALFGDAQLVKYLDGTRSVGRTHS